MPFNHPAFEGAQAYVLRNMRPRARTEDLHSDDSAVDRFAAELKTKLAAAREKGSGGWETCPPEDLSRMLREHVEKGDPRDVANFAMFLWSLGQPISAAMPTQDIKDDQA